MTHEIKMPDKHPDSIEPYFIVWCDIDAKNDGSTTDDGELQGAEIATCEWILPDGIESIDDNIDAVTINAVDYAANTVSTIWLSGGSSGSEYRLTCIITTDETPVRTLAKTIIIPVWE